YTRQLDTVIGLLEKIQACVCSTDVAAENEAATALQGSATSLDAAAAALEGAAAALRGAALLSGSPRAIKGSGTKAIGGGVRTIEGGEAAAAAVLEAEQRKTFWQWLLRRPASTDAPFVGKGTEA